MNDNPVLHAVCKCSWYDFESLLRRLGEDQQYQNYRDVILLQWKQQPVFIFNYGVVVYWQLEANDQAAVEELLTPFARNPVSATLDDDFTWETGAGKTALKNDHICLTEDSIELRLAVSHGIAQSTKLMQYEARIQNTISTTEHIPEKIALTGSSGLRRRELAQLRGQLYLTKSDVMLHYDLLDIPDFFWENPDLQPHYAAVIDYLEVSQRIEVVNKKLETIQDLLQMIADEQKHAHSSMLEWIIILLIAVDILIMLFQEYVR